MRKLLLQTAKRHHIVISDTAVNIALKNNQLKQRVTRKQLRDELTIKQLQQQIVNHFVKVSDLEVTDRVNQKLKGLKEQIRLVDVLIQPQKTAEETSPKDVQAVAQEVLEKLKTQSGDTVAQQYQNVVYNDLGWVALGQVPPFFAKVLVDLPLNQYASPIVDTDGVHILKIIDKRQQNKSSSISQWRVSHILLKEGKKAKATIDKIYQQLKQGVKFSVLAKRDSQDPGSASNGGSLGWVSAGQMVPEFEAVMVKTPVGHISRPFKSRFGYHILKVEANRKRPVSNRKALEQQAKAEIFQRQAPQVWERWVSNLREASHVEIRDKNI